MKYARNSDREPTTCEVIDFDEALLDARPAEEKAELLTEARMLAQAFAPEGDLAQLERMALTLSSGARDAEMGRAHARKLAAALRHLIRDPWG